jgi:hypothetical protein
MPLPGIAGSSIPSLHHHDLCLVLAVAVPLHSLGRRREVWACSGTASGLVYSAKG